MRNTALALLVSILAPGVLQAATGLFDSLELTVLRSDRIALIQIPSSVDSAYAPPAKVGVRKMRYLCGTFPAPNDRGIFRIAPYSRHRNSPHA